MAKWLILSRKTDKLATLPTSLSMEQLPPSKRYLFEKSTAEGGGGEKGEYVAPVETQDRPAARKQSGQGPKEGDEAW